MVTETCLAALQWFANETDCETEGSSRLMDRVSKAAEGGINWLVEAVETEQVSVTSPIGFYFAKLWYHEKLYPLIFATGALAAAVARQENNQT